jgi:hypothetical protein
MTIRPADPSDVDAIVGMGLRFLAGTRYAQFLPPNPDAMRALAERLIADPHTTLLVAERDDAIVAMIGFMVYDHPISGERCAGEVFWWSESPGAGMRVWKQAETWALDQGAVVLQMIAPTPEVARVYERRGYALVESCYQRRV